MITEIREIYKCDFCNKMYQRKFWAEYHEKRCSKNPENYRPCFNCPFSVKTKVRVAIFLDWENEERTYDREIIYCEKKNIGICPPFQEPYEYVEIDGKEIVNENMPKQCDIFDEQDYFPTEQILP